jgi:flagellar assembly factor FliW
MQLETTRFGSIDVDDGAVLTFTQPIIGFQQFRRFVLLPGGDDSGLSWLQSVDSGDLAFIVVDPRVVVRDYEFKLSRHELDELAVDSERDLDVYTLVVVPADAAGIRTNLKAPILVNRAQRLAKQTILEHSDYPVRFELRQAQAGAHSPQEVSHARTDS